MTPLRTRSAEVRSLPIYEAGSVETPYVIRGMVEEVHRDTHWEPHAHPAHELAWNVWGASTMRIGSRSWTITPGHGLWIPAGVVHQAHAPAGTRYCAAMFGLRASAGLPEEPTAVEITPLLALLLARLGEPELSERSRDVTESMVLDVLVPSMTELMLTVPQSTVLEPMVERILGDPADPRGLREWAQELGLSTRTITRILTEQTGRGFSRWRMTVRAQHAVRLLAHGRGIEDVAEETGYRTVSAFGAAFKECTGLTPGELRATLDVSEQR
ncbi:MAG: AraC family transcriptional regulator [Micrococcaceae bacterium]